MTTRHPETPSAKGKRADRKPPHPTQGDTRRHRAKGEEARAEVARLLAEGFNVSEVARRVGLSRQTVSEWRNQKAGVAVPPVRAKRAQGFEDAVAEARKELKAATVDAARLLVKQLKSADEGVAQAAAKTLLDRSGLPRVEVVHTEAEPLDLSGLSDEELEFFERVILPKLKGGTT